MELEVEVGTRYFAITFMEHNLEGKPIGSEVVTSADGFSMLEKIGLLEMLKQKLLNENEEILKNGNKEQEQG